MVNGKQREHRPAGSVEGLRAAVEGPAEQAEQQDRDEHERGRPPGAVGTVGSCRGGRGTMTTMAGATDRAAVLNRVKRAQGQLAGVLRMIEEERDLTSVLNQIKAVSSALDRAGFALVAGEWRSSISDGEVTPEQLEHLEKLFLTLA